MSAKGMDLNRRRSRFVFERAASWRQTELKEITAKAQGLPVTLRSQGLVVTMARLASGDDKASRTLNEMLFQWLVKERVQSDHKSTPATEREFLEQLMDVDRASYLAAQREALALAERIKLISKAFFSGKEEKDAL